MGHVARWIIGLAVALLIGAASLALLVLQAEPSVVSPAVVEPRDVERALRLARAHDPRRALPGIVRTLRLSQHEAELLLGQAATRMGGGRAQLELPGASARLRASLPLPWPVDRRWINVDLQAVAGKDLPVLQSVRIGSLPVPAVLAKGLIGRLAASYGLAGLDGQAVLDLQRVRFGPGQLHVVYAWGPEAPKRLLAALSPQGDQARLRVYAERLAALTAPPAPSLDIPLPTVLGPMFELARQRSRAGSDPAVENRTVLWVLGLVSGGVGLWTMLPEREAELRRRPIGFTLAGRRDFPQHFLASANIAADSGGLLADRVGLVKELDDARFGSGFSFNDLAANRAGTRFGELAVRDPAGLQGRLLGGVAEHDILPDLSDLPEFLHEREFRQRYGGPGSPAYESLTADIERRLMATPLFR